MKTVHCTGSPVTDTSSQLGDMGSGEWEREVEGGDCTYRLEELAYLRSGDKGNTANIGRGHLLVNVCHCNVQCHKLVPPGACALPGLLWKTRSNLHE